LHQYGSFLAQFQKENDFKEYSVCIFAQ